MAKPLATKLTTARMVANERGMSMICKNCVDVNPSSERLLHNVCCPTHTCRSMQEVASQSSSISIHLYLQEIETISASQNKCRRNSHAPGPPTGPQNNYVPAALLGSHHVDTVQSSNTPCIQHPLHLGA